MPEILNYVMEKVCEKGPAVACKLIDSIGTNRAYLRHSRTRTADFTAISRSSTTVLSPLPRLHCSTLKEPKTPLN